MPTKILEMGFDAIQQSYCTAINQPQPYLKIQTARTLAEQVKG
jgi:hypothetical protein